jgi:hypothetical protein
MPIVKLDAAWMIARRTLERRTLQLRQRVGHAGVAASLVLKRDPALFRIYQQAMRAGYPPEFQRPKPKPTTRRQRAWHRIEQAARSVVARTAEPMTLRDAVIGVVRQHPSWYEEYRDAR